MKKRWRRWLFRGSIALAVLGAAGFLLAASGVISLKASAGHWGITEWMLQFGKRRSLATHSLGIDLPPLDDPALVAKGAAHYETGCRPCHGSPGHERPRIAMAMLPPPPLLSPRVAARDPEELFYVIKHGIKFTGMPAWPSQQRDDEVHAIVAFLLRLPSLDADAYHDLAYGSDSFASFAPELPDLSSDLPGPLRALSASCNRCHGAGGQGRDVPAAPRLAGQKPEYLERALVAYATGSRHSGIMEPVAAGLTADERQTLAAHYSGRSGALADDAEPGAAWDPALARGRAIVLEGIPARGVPPCQDCHGPGPQPRNTAYPVLAGQYPAYLVLQLELFARGQRGGSSYAHLMQRIAKRLEPQHMRDAAAYYGSLGGSGSAIDARR